MPDLCAVSGTLVAPDGSVPPDPYLKVTKLVKNGVAVSTADKVFTYNPETGALSLSLLRGSVATLRGNVEGFSGPNGRAVAIPDSASATLESLVPAVVSTPTNASFNFLALLDTPNSYAGQSGKVPVVNGAENALEFVDVASEAEVAAAVESAASEEATARDAAIATASALDRARANHTGTQAISTIVGLQAALDTLNAGERLLSTTPNVNLNAAAGTKTTLYTCPAGKSCVVTKVVARSPSTTISTVLLSFGWNAGATNWLEDFFPAITTTQFFMIQSRELGTVSAVGVAGETFKVVIGTPEGSAATCTLDVFGYLVDV